MSRVANSNSRLTHGLEAYTKVKVIGKGSYGEVWLVQHKRDKKQYVFKRMNLSRSSERERNAAEQEAKLLAKLKHPNIVSYKDSFETPSHDLYIVMGFCEGGDLYSRLKQQKGDSLDERQVVEWFVQIAMALQYMHERNILHRDLKTQNIFLTKSKIIKVGDLGIARVLDSSNDMATTHIGTPYYMSPELFSDKPYNHRSDVWALGCCVYEMATLRHAFNARDMNSLVYKILKGKMPIMPKIYSIELCNLIKAMLNHNPDKRPSVNRILRDPYIKKNIAMFLESTKRTRASSQASRNDKSTAVPKSNNTRVAKSSSTPSNRSAALVEKLEPLNVGPDLDPIVEEATPRVTPTPRVGSASRHSHESRSHSSQSRPALPSKVMSSDKSPSPSRHKSAQHRSSPSPSRQRHRRKDSIDEKPHTNDRPLPPKPPSVSQPKQSTAMPTKSRIKSRESGYGSVSSAHSQEDSRQSSRTNSSSVSDIQNSQGDRRQSETPRPMSARAKRRERIEIVTPRISSSVDLKPSRVRVKSDSTDNRSRSHGSRPLSGEPRLRHIQNSPPILRPQKSAHSSVEKSTDSNCRDEIDAVAVKVNSSDVHKSDSSSSLRQRSLGDDSSSTNSTDEEVIEEKEERRNSTEMVNFISVLDSTLHAGSNRPEDKGIDPGEEENIGAVPVVVETSEVLRGLEYRGDDVSPEIDVDDITSKPQQSRRYNDNNPGPVNTLGTSTRLAARIQLLRKDCVVNLGYKKLKAAYDILNNVTGDSLEERMIELLGQKDYDMFAGKIWQLKFCEDAVFVL